VRGEEIGRRKGRNSIFLIFFRQQKTSLIVASNLKNSAFAAYLLIRNKDRFMKKMGEEFRFLKKKKSEISEETYLSANQT
jgi:hypothetical protein